MLPNLGHQIAHVRMLRVNVCTTCNYYTQLIDRDSYLGGCKHCGTLKVMNDSCKQSRDVLVPTNTATSFNQMTAYMGVFYRIAETKYTSLNSG